MVVKLEITNDQIQALRNAFLNDFSSKGNSGVHPKDLERVKTSDGWLQRFLLHNEGDQTLSLKMLWTSLTWRLDNNVNEITEDKCKMELLCSGSFYPFGADIDGCMLLVFKCKKYVKGSVDMDEIKKCIIYWFERIERLVQEKQITIFFDMESCGLSNMDLELIKYLINMFKEYYPYFLNYILIFEMPWILNAAFKIVKAMLPEKAVEKIKFISKKDIKTFVPPEHVLTCWGGGNSYSFSFESEKLPDTVPAVVNNNSKKVHFVDGSMSEISAGSVDKESAVSDGSFLRVTPSGIITFVKDGGELVSTLELQNTDSTIHLSFKLKTTSPEKFRVKPSTGCLAPGESTTVTVTLLLGFQLGGLTRDKFLVMSTALEPNELENLDLAELWKNQSNRKVNQHRLKCIQSGSEVTNNNSNNPQLPNTSHEDDQNFNKLSAALSQLENSQRNLQKSVITLQSFQLATIILVVFLGVILGYLIHTSGKEVLPENAYCRDVNQP